MTNHTNWSSNRLQLMFIEIAGLTSCMNVRSFLCFKMIRFGRKEEKSGGGGEV